MKEYDTKTPFLGANIVNNKITTVLKGTSAYAGGLNVNDEIVEIDGVKYPVGSSYISGKQVGDTIKVKVKRFGREFIYDLKLMPNPSARIKLERVENISAEQEELYKKWLFIK